MPMTTEGRKRVGAATKKRRAEMPRKKLIAMVSKMGRASRASLTPEQRTESARNAVKARWARYYAARKQAA